MGGRLGAGAFAGTSAPLLKSYSLMGETETQLSYLARISCTVGMSTSRKDPLHSASPSCDYRDVEVWIGR